MGRIKMKANKQPKHFVLVHGMGHGAWCWYKLSALLQKAGHKVTALDMAASGINMTPIEEVFTFEQYSQPLLDFMALLSTDEKVTVVGHSLGGMNIALAMEMFPQKISAAVFVSAVVPDTIHQPSFVLDKFVELIPKGAWLDTETSTYGCREDPLTAMLFGPQFLQILYSQCPIEDFELAKALHRKSSLFLPDLLKAKKFSNNGYGSVKRVYVLSKEDRGITEAFSNWMIENSEVQEVKVIEGADHMIMLSQPQRLCNCLSEIEGV